MNAKRGDLAPRSVVLETVTLVDFLDYERLLGMVKLNLCFSRRLTRRHSGACCCWDGSGRLLHGRRRVRLLRWSSTGARWPYTGGQKSKRYENKPMDTHTTSGLSKSGLIRHGTTRVFKSSMRRLDSTHNTLITTGIGGPENNKGQGGAPLLASEKWPAQQSTPRDSHAIRVWISVVAPGSRPGN